MPPCQPLLPTGTAARHGELEHEVAACAVSSAWEQGLSVLMQSIRLKRTQALGRSPAMLESVVLG